MDIVSIINNVEERQTTSITNPFIAQANQHNILVNVVLLNHINDYLF